MALPYLSSSACFLHICKNSCCRSSHLQLTCSHSPSPLLYSPCSTDFFFPHISASSMMIVIEGERIEEVKEFCFLGSMISNDAKCHREIRRRIAMGKEAFLKRKELLRGGLKRSLKKRMIKTLILSVTLYCAETWTMRQVDIARLEDF